MFMPDVAMVSLVGCVAIIGVCSRIRVRSPSRVRTDPIAWHWEPLLSTEPRITGPPLTVPLRI